MSTGRLAIYLFPVEDPLSLSLSPSVLETQHANESGRGRHFDFSTTTAGLTFLRVFGSIFKRQ